MIDSESKPWPPPPDIESIRELVRVADPEGHLTEGAHPDEYEPEEEAIFEAVGDLQTSDLLATNTLPIIQAIWQNSFNLDDAAMTRRKGALLALAQQIERFFGPAAAPQVRSPQNTD